MSDTSGPARIDPNVDPVNYVKVHLWPPLPTVFGTWLGDLLHRARNAADPDMELAVPDAVLETGIGVPGSRYDEPSGTHVITLFRALSLFAQAEALFPDDAEYADEPVTIFEPYVALTLANTATPATVEALHDPICVDQYAAEITAGTWQYQKNPHVIVGRDGRLLSGLNVLLAIIKANTPAPVLAEYDGDDDDGPYTWRPPVPPAACPMSGDTVSRWHAQPGPFDAIGEEMPDPGPYTEGETVTCSGCGATVPVTPVADTIRSAGRQYVARLAEHMTP